MQFFYKKYIGLSKNIQIPQSYLINRASQKFYRIGFFRTKSAKKIIKSFLKYFSVSIWILISIKSHLNLINLFNNSKADKYNKNSRNYYMDRNNLKKKAKIFSGSYDK